MTTNQPILIVEDSPEDYEATVRAFRKAGLANPIFHCEDGDEALDFLSNRGEFENASLYPKPGIILLDLNLPGTDGREVLSEIKADKNLKRIPVVILTTSNDEKDVRSCYEAGANSYIQKPVNMERFIRAVQMLKDYWFNISILPKQS
ncbi:MAG: response regulator [Calditrichaeota bacterium]|nr:response regulator [Calditrichota bacterium]